MIGQARLVNGSYHLVPLVNSIVVATCSSAISKSNLWHSHLGHLSKGSLKLISTTDPAIHNDLKDPCDYYYYAKQKRLSFPLSNSVSQTAFELIHVDI